MTTFDFFYKTLQRIEELILNKMLVFFVRESDILYSIILLPQYRKKRKRKSVHEMVYW